MPLEKVWRNTWSVNSSGWLYCKSLCVQGCYRHASRTERQGVGALGIIYWGSRRAVGSGGRMWGMYCAAVYVVWPQDGYLTTYRQTRCSEEPTNANRGKWNMVLMTVRALTYTQARVRAMTHTLLYTQAHVIAKKSRPGLDGLNGLVPPVLRGNVVLCCERSLPLSGAPAWGQTGGC